ncbi:MAG: glycosyltransferase [Pseudomonadota bacterium]
MTITFPSSKATGVALPKSDLTLVVPCYNEERRLNCQQFIEFVDTVPRVHILFVNDGSKDNTLSVLHALQMERPLRFSVLDIPENGGKSEAVRAGLVSAIEDGAELVAYWDADLATPLELVEDFLRIADRHADMEVIFGSRRRMLGHRVERTISRRMVSSICAGLARVAIGIPVADTQCGAKLLRVTPALKSAIATPFSAGWLFDVELFARISHVGGTKRFYELPLSEWSEIPGSKVSGGDIVRSGLCMLRLILEMRIGEPMSAHHKRIVAPGDFQEAV